MLARLSIIIPVLDEAAAIAAALAALAPLRARGAEVIVVDGGSRDGTVAARAPARRPRHRGAARARRADECRRRRGARRRAAVPACRHAAAARTPTAWCSTASRDPAATGAASTCASRAAAAAAARRRHDEPALAPDRHRHRRPGDVRHARGVRRAPAAFPTIALMEDVALSARLKRISRPLCLRARVTTSGRRWETHGVLRTILLMWRLRLAYFFGARSRRRSRGATAMPPPTEPVAIAILAKAPVPGRQDAPDPGARRACAPPHLQERLTERTVATALRRRIGPVTLWARPTQPIRCSATGLALRGGARGASPMAISARACSARVAAATARARHRHRLPGADAGASCAQPPRHPALTPTPS